MSTTIEYVDVKGTKEGVEFILSGYDVQVVTFRFTEEGYGLAIEGNRCEVESLLIELEETGVLI